MNARIAVVEDDAVQAELLADLLRSEGHTVLTYPDGQVAREALEQEVLDVDLVLTDVAMPRFDGLQLCATLKESRPELPVIVVTAESKLDTAVTALRAGAYDFISKPVEASLLFACVQRAAERRALSRALARHARAGADQTELLGESEAMQQVRDLVQRVASSGASVLVQGETGTGKELVARALHGLSPRAKGPFVAINCAALPAALVESELFGYAKGAFTDARAARSGLFVEASGGTLFLDEVAELSPDNQAKLLRALQEKKVRPLGSTSELSFDARVLCASHKDLEGEVDAGRFRSDLFFRLNVVRIELPPLRDRGLDVVQLAGLFIERICARDGRAKLTLSPELAQKLLSYGWPGNVRELENCVERLVALARGSELAVGDLPEKLRSFQKESFRVSVDAAEEIVALDEFEKRYVLRVLQLSNDNRSRAAELLGIDRRTLYRKLESWGLPTLRAADAHAHPNQ